MECKESRSRKDVAVWEVLIETLWNVKICRILMLYRRSSVLIETLWNVKEAAQLNEKGQPEGINRNIVECKDV